MRAAGVGLGQLLLALDATLVSLVEAPRGLDLTVASAALVDSDDVRLGLAEAAGSADAFFLLGVTDDEALRWIDGQARAPVAIFVKEPADAVVAKAVRAGSAVVAVEPRARWERLYQLVNHVLEHHGDRGDPMDDSGTDLFGLAQSLADRIHGMVSIEDAQSHVLAYSASNEDADELRRLSILGRAGPPEHLEWLAQWGIFDALRASSEVVRVAERPELALCPRLAIGIHQPPVARRPPVFVGAIWVQQGSQPLADDAEEILQGAAVLAARIMARLAARPSTHARRVQQLLGLADGEPLEVAAIARELGLPGDGNAALIGFDTIAPENQPARLTDVLALSASAFRRDAQVGTNGSRIYVVLPHTATARAVTSWVRGTVSSLRAELGVHLRAAIAAPVAGLRGIAAARSEVDSVLDSAVRHPISIGQVTSVAEARTAVLLDEIVTLVGSYARLVDPRISEMRIRDPALAETLRVYLDSFGDIGAAAQSLQVHPNTVRYRVRRIEKLLSTSLADPDVRLLFSLALRVTERSG
ncbi:PucR family transcriptional regulator [Mycobacterium persicum]|uniref:Purine catabolism regulatory protein n=1 Tax=Mycobacterium persicum TaxID=1487726 RepID=A0AB38UXQ1_9MYCO|nr:helix-turn-helix domain-containing protein [Mycobacterium persicum]ORB89009.1 transcriptional regulator [Mycobacterium persicum]VAZ85224.1 Purine catabolism regulatory protein [Mycobacterium persicum]